VLEGSVRRSTNRVRINTQLIDAETDAHLWAERFDGETEDLFVLQDEVTRRIALALDLELISAEATRKIDHPDALDCILRGRAAEAKLPTRDTSAEAIGWVRAGTGARSTICPGTEPFGRCACRPRVGSNDRHRCRGPRPRRSPARVGLGAAHCFISAQANNPPGWEL